MRTDLIAILSLALLLSCSSRTGTGDQDTEQSPDLRGNGLFLIEPGRGLTVDDRVLDLGMDSAELQEAFPDSRLLDLGPAGRLLELHPYGAAALIGPEDKADYFFVYKDFPAEIQDLAPGAARAELEQVFGPGKPDPFGLFLVWPEVGLAAELDGESTVSFRISEAAR